MTSAARNVLEDCRGALLDFADGIQGGTWRRRWVSCVVLLRTVGYVLDKVDADRSPKHRSVIDSWWRGLKGTKPDPAIFWGFIDEERNLIIKEYRTRAGQGVTVPGAVMEIDAKTMEQKIEPRRPVVYHYTMNSGPFSGRDQRELIAEAIAWWERQLDAIDAAVSIA